MGVHRHHNNQNTPACFLPWGKVMYEYNATIVRVVDGDTVDVDIDLGFDCWFYNQRIRLSGIDTPECRTRDKQEKAHGLLAKKFVQENLAVGKVYRLQTKEKGKFGRYLGEFKTGKGFITRLLLKAKLAVPYEGQSKKEIKAAHEVNRKQLGMR